MYKNIFFGLVLFHATSLMAAASSQGSTGFEFNAGLSRNPVDIGNQLYDDNQEKTSAFDLTPFTDAFQPWFDFKDQLDRDHGFKFGLAWTPLYQTASSSPGLDHAAGAIFELFGTWNLYGRDSDHPGTLGFRIEDRYRLGTDLAPQFLGAESGSTWSTATGFAEFDLTVAEFWWEQHLVGDKFAFRAGKVLAFAIYDYFRFKNPKTGFLNQMFNVNPTIPFPSFGLGVAFRAQPTKDIYILAGIHDANGTPSDVGFDTFFNDREYFTAFEVGLAPGYLSGRRESFFDGSDYHLTIWHTDARKKIGRPSGHGFLLSAEQPIGDQILFARYGYADGRVTPVGQMAAAGIAFTNMLDEKDDVIGLGVGWGRNNLGSIMIDDGTGNIIKINADGLNQYTVETFYRIQFTPRLSITADAQVIVNPSLNVDKDSIGYFGLRLRLAI
jgi:porin